MSCHDSAVSKIFKRSKLGVTSRSTAKRRLTSYWKPTSLVPISESRNKSALWSRSDQKGCGSGSLWMGHSLRQEVVVILVTSDWGRCCQIRVDE
ncbi:hypothetical protein CPB83DRAFT_417164 [Crepidotus variabilis]|uniref:Uncharacterized protein n=1 Tax=Crepidotus variabilis TaxID=179855 RepID=A0A9P6ESA4_9AGAR|nr:hypothetical protein CPB83DRAFT_417164 [Crepidotus variabilis]